MEKEHGMCREIQGDERADVKIPDELDCTSNTRSEIVIVRYVSAFDLFHPLPTPRYNRVNAI